VVLYPVSVYASEIKPLLPVGSFAPARSRLLWLPAHVLVIASSFVAIARHWLPWPALLGLSVLVGVSFAGLTFLGHEALHGAVVRGLALRRCVGWLGFLPFAVSPTLWTAWHNRVHHGRTNRPDLDPDSYPTLNVYRRDRVTRLVTDHLAPGRHRWFGIVLSLLIGFSVQSFHMLVDARRRGFLSPREHVRAILQSALGVGLWCGFAFLVGAQAFLLCFVLPLFVANAIVMSFIFTNHSLSPLTDVNDPLANSLSVTAPRWLEWLTLGFGLHVEHHLFPAMSSRHARKVREVILARWPERYQSRPLASALVALHHSPRVYKTSTTLIDPKSGDEWPTCGGTHE
jgi:fatty acid desaturase